MLGTFCIDRCPFMIKKVQIHYVIRLKSPACLWEYYVLRGRCWKSYNNKISPLFSSDCLIADQILYNIIQMPIQKFLGKNRLPSRGQGTFPQLGMVVQILEGSQNHSLALLVSHSDWLHGYNGIKLTRCSKNVTPDCCHVYYFYYIYYFKKLPLFGHNPGIAIPNIWKVLIHETVHFSKLKHSDSVLLKSSNLQKPLMQICSHFRVAFWFLARGTLLVSLFLKYLTPPAHTDWYLGQIFRFTFYIWVKKIIFGPQSNSFCSGLGSAFLLRVDQIKWLCWLIYCNPHNSQ